MVRTWLQLRRTKKNWSVIKRHQQWKEKNEKCPFYHSETLFFLQFNDPDWRPLGEPPPPAVYIYIYVYTHVCVCACVYIIYIYRKYIHIYIYIYLSIYILLMDWWPPPIMGIPVSIWENTTWLPKASGISIISISMSISQLKCWYMLILTNSYMAADLIYIPLSVNGHSSQIKKWLSRIFRGPHGYLWTGSHVKIVREICRPKNNCFRELRKSCRGVSCWNPGGLCNGQSHLWPLDPQSCTSA